MMLENLSGEILVPMSLIFSRVGAAFFMFPAIGSKYIMSNAKLVLALLVSIILFPILKDFMPKKIVTEKSVLQGSDISCLTALINTNFIDQTTKFGEIPARNDLVFFYNVLKKTDAIPIKEILATYRLKKVSVSSNKLRALKYQYVVNRIYAKKGVFLSLQNLVKWMLYGYRKYRI